MWKEIGTDVKKTLFKDLVKMLYKKQCSDVAEYLVLRQEEALKLLQTRYKSMKDLRRVKSKKQATEQEGLHLRLIIVSVLTTYRVIGSPAESTATALSATLATCIPVEQPSLQDNPV